MSEINHFHFGQNVVASVRYHRVDTYSQPSVCVMMLYKTNTIIFIFL